MHHTLDIQEILLVIFSHCEPCVPSRRGSDLPALARTCRAFTEPALDVLWETLDELSPLMRCLPEACTKVIRDDPSLQPRTQYRFSRPLDQAEWATLRSYARRVRSIIEVRNRLDGECFRTLSNPPTAEPLFPNLRRLRYKYTDDTALLLHHPLPSLMSLDLVFHDLSALQAYLDSFRDPQPGVRRVSFYVRQPAEAFFFESMFDPGWVGRWENLQSLVCPQIILPPDTLVHLSHMPSIMQLTFNLVAPPVTADKSKFPPLAFRSLRHLTVHAASLSQTAQLLAMIKVPLLTDLFARINLCPSRPDLTSFMAGVQTCGARALERLALEQSVPRIARRSRFRIQTDAEAGPALELADLRVPGSLQGLRTLNLDFAWSVDLRDADVLALAGAWPRLELFALNASAGWHRGDPGPSGARGGVTPEGLRGVLWACPRLRWAALALDVSGDTVQSLRDARPRFGDGASRTLTLDVVDSPIEVESVGPVGAFLASVAGDVTLRAWRGGGIVCPGGWEMYRERWKSVGHVMRLATAGRWVVRMAFDMNERWKVMAFDRNSRGRVEEKTRGGEWETVHGGARATSVVKLAAARDRQSFASVERGGRA